MIDLQQATAELAQKYGLDAPIIARYTDLVSELGELGKELLVGSNYGANELEMTENTAKEMGDVVFALVLLANSLDLDLETCLNMALEKYHKRFGETGQIGS